MCPLFGGFTVVGSYACMLPLVLVAEEAKLLLTLAAVLSLTYLVASGMTVETPAYKPGYGPGVIDSAQVQSTSISAKKKKSLLY